MKWLKVNFDFLESDENGGNMYIYIGALIFGGIAVMTILVAIGLPLGEFTMGGQHKVLPTKFRLMALGSVIVQLFAVILILQAGAIVPLLFSYHTTRILCYVFSAYLLINIFSNLMSKSKKEKYVMTPLSVIACICYFLAALNMK